MLRNRWVRRAAIGLGVAVVAGAAYLVYSRYATRSEGEDRLAVIIAELDASDPNWRFAELEAARGHLPDQQNSALLVPKFTAALRAPKLEAVRPDGQILLFNGPPNRWLDDEADDAIEQALDRNDRALGVARSFKDRPRGLRRLTISADFIGTLMPHLQETRVIYTALDLDAERLARGGRPGAALQHVPAMVHAARSIDGEPMLLAALVRMAGTQMAARRAERVLALGQTKGGLWSVQGALGREAEADVFWPALRGERAGIDELFRNLESGLLPVGRYLEALDMTDPAGSRKQIRRPELVEEIVYSPNLPGDHARYLEYVTRACEVGKLPEHEQRKAMAAALADPVDPGHRFTRLLTGGAYAKLHDASLRSRALLRCAMVGLAVERSRLRDGHWPESLAEVPQDILPAIPPDPFDGKPLRYVRREDGVTVYSVGPDEQDNSGRAVDGEEGKAPGTDVCFRLYDPKARGLPALPRPRMMEIAEPGIELGPAPREVDRD